VTILSGKLFMGMGNKLDKTHATGLPVGGYALMPANKNHFAFTTAETTIHYVPLIGFRRRVGALVPSAPSSIVAWYVSGYGHYQPRAHQSPQRPKHK
jgi:hypothetical protein